jgi:hypothetical protein
MKNKILKGITIVAWILLMIFIIAADSQNIWIPMIGMLICGAWLSLFYFLNEDKLLKELLKELLKD